jgi:ubiquitin-protein ligase E3 C
MFDGSYRSRREINLGGSSGARIKSTNAPRGYGKQTTLQIAQEQRELRRIQSLREVSAKIVQKYFRRFLQQKLFSLTLAANVYSVQPPLGKQMSILALRLSPNLVRFWPTPVDTKFSSLQKLAANASSSTETWGQQGRYQPSVFVSTQICSAALHSLLQDNYSSIYNNVVLLQWVYALCERDINTLKNLYYNRVLSSSLKLVLAKTLTTEEDDVIAKTLIDLFFLLVNYDTTSATTVAVLAATLVTTSLHRHPLRGYIEFKAGAAQAPQLWWIHLFQCLSVLLADDTSNENNSITYMLKSFLRGYELFLLDNTLDLIWNTTTTTSKTNRNEISKLIIFFIHFALQHHPELTYLSSWLALHNDNNTIMEYFSSDDDDTKMIENQGEDDADAQSDSSSSDNEQQQTANATGQRITSTAATAPSRAEFSTVKSLDSYYKRYLSKQRSNIITSGGCSGMEQRLLKKLSYILGHGDLVAELGAQMFTSAPSETATSANYSMVLYNILSDSSGVRTNSSPLLTKLAFHCHPSSIIVTGLWNLIYNNKSRGNSHYYKVASVFCDVFSHALLPVDDDEFADVSSYISIPEVVQFLNQELFEVYWVHPVLLTPSFNDEVDDGRFRFLLSGTKLFNSLHERWCRQNASAKFCTEESWCWKFTVSANDAAASVNITEYNNEYMDEDDDNDDLHMENTSSAASNNIYARRRHQEEEGEDAILACAFRDPKLARVLTACPQVIPFNQRVQMFHSLLEGDKLTTQDDTAAQQSMLRHMLLHGDEPFRHRIHVRVRRDDLFSDSLRQLNTFGKKLREKVQVTMINKHGTEESGIDGGGVFKEFLDDLIRESFLQNTADGVGLFSVSPLETLYVNPSAISSVSHSINENLLLQYEFLGRVLGKAVYESILVEPQFSLAFLNLILGKQNSLDDLKTFDPELSRHLSSLRKMDETVLASLGLTFEVTSAYTNRGQFVSSATGSSSIPLLPHGESIAVTKSNVIQYVHLVAHHKLNVEGSIQTKAFLRGFRDLIPASWVRLFSASELQKLISGDDAVKGIDVEDMKRSMQYAGGYHPSQPIIIWFWEVLTEMSAEQQRKFLKFMTSCSRQPLLGFQALIPLPCIQQIHLDESNRERLPTSSTCMNLLKLPKYDSKETLREKLLYAVEAGAGFELT